MFRVRPLALVALVAFALVALAPTPASALYSEGGDVRILTAGDFNKIVVKDASTFWLVEFYAPWCGHCKALAPEYVAAAKALRGSGAKLGAVDCDAHKSLCDKYDVRGFPTVKAFEPDRKTSPSRTTARATRTASSPSSRASSMAEARAARTIRSPLASPTPTCTICSTSNAEPRAYPRDARRRASPRGSPPSPSSTSEAKSATSPFITRGSSPIRVSRATSSCATRISPRLCLRARDGNDGGHHASPSPPRSARKPASASRPPKRSWTRGAPTPRTRPARRRCLRSRSLANPVRRRTPGGALRGKRDAACFGAYRGTCVIAVVDAPAGGRVRGTRRVGGAFEEVPERSVLVRADRRRRAAFVREGV